jgi:hypothetical protein
MLPVVVEPNTHLNMSGWLSADHVTFRDMLLGMNVTTAADTNYLKAIFQVRPGAHVSQLQFEGSQAWVGQGAGEGFVMRGNAGDYTYHSGVALRNIRFEGLDSWSIRIAMGSTNRALRHLLIENCELAADTENMPNGVYTRYVDMQTWINVHAMHSTDQTVANIANASSVQWINTQVQEPAGTLTLSGLTQRYAYAKSGYTNPHTALWTS